jgi:chaperone required for assembly of F1-ATPase
MREMFDEIFSKNPFDPVEAARRAVRPQLRRRFYATATAGEGGDGHPILLDGRPVRTPARNGLCAPTRALAEAIAAEWAAQEDVIDPARMPLTRLANTIIDGVAAAPAAVADEIGKYLGCDLLLYRAEQPDAFVARQAQHWDPILTWAREALGARFILSEGVVFVEQPERAVAAARAAIPADPWRLGAVHAIATLTGSALLALAVLRGRLPADEVWTAAHVDEDWNMQQWGEDELALARRAFRFAELQAAATILVLV